MSETRQAIFERIKKGKPSPRPLPSIPMFPVKGETLTNFLGHLKGFDGEYKMFPTRQAAVQWLQNGVVVKGKKVYSTIEDLDGVLRPSDFDTPAAMNVIDICVLESPLGIGETGSLLVESETMGNPAAALFSTDLYILVDRNALVSSLQEAYSKIDLAKYQYSAFFSGPSATADIEAVHITGAQGEISLTAVVYNCTPEEMQKDVDVATATPCAPAIKLSRETDPATGQDAV